MASKETIIKAERIRSTIKGQLTRAYNWIRTFDMQCQQIEAVEVRLAAIKRMWLEFREKQDALENLDSEFENDGEREAFGSLPEVRILLRQPQLQRRLSPRHKEANQTKVKILISAIRIIGIIS